ncbi:MAG: DUF1858 domain-containing protein [Candidatus Aenigmatarchaeota archaeon]
MKKITKSTAISTAIEMNPKAADIMFSRGLHCIGCHASGFETIEQGAKVHGMGDKEIENMLKEINSTIKKRSVKKKIKITNKKTKQKRKTVR